MIRPFSTSADNQTKELPPVDNTRVGDTVGNVNPIGPQSSQVPKLTTPINTKNILTPETIEVPKASLNITRLEQQDLTGKIPSAFALKRKTYIIDDTKHYLSNILFPLVDEFNKKFIKGVKLFDWDSYDTYINKIRTRIPVIGLVIALWKSDALTESKKLLSLWTALFKSFRIDTQRFYESAKLREAKLIINQYFTTTFHSFRAVYTNYINDNIVIILMTGILQTFIAKLLRQPFSSKYVKISKTITSRGTVVQSGIKVEVYEGTTRVLSVTVPITNVIEPKPMNRIFAALGHTLTDITSRFTVTTNEFRVAKWSQLVATRTIHASSRIDDAFVTSQTANVTHYESHLPYTFTNLLMLLMISKYTNQVTKVPFVLNNMLFWLTTNCYEMNRESWTSTDITLNYTLSYKGMPNISNTDNLVKWTIAQYNEELPSSFTDQDFITAFVLSACDFTEDSSIVNKVPNQYLSMWMNVTTKIITEDREISSIIGRNWLSGYFGNTDIATTMLLVRYLGNWTPVLFMNIFWREQWADIITECNNMNATECYTFSDYLSLQNAFLYIYTVLYHNVSNWLLTNELTVESYPRLFNMLRLVPKSEAKPQSKTSAAKPVLTGKIPLGFGTNARREAAKADIQRRIDEMMNEPVIQKRPVPIITTEDVNLSELNLETNESNVESHPQVISEEPHVDSNEINNTEQQVANIEDVVSQQPHDDSVVHIRDMESKDSALSDKDLPVEIVATVEMPAAAKDEVVVVRDEVPQELVGREEMTDQEIIQASVGSLLLPRYEGTSQQDVSDLVIIKQMLTDNVNMSTSSADRLARTLNNTYTRFGSKLFNYFDFKDYNLTVQQKESLFTPSRMDGKYRNRFSLIEYFSYAYGSIKPEAYDFYDIKADHTHLLAKSGLLPGWSMIHAARLTDADYLLPRLFVLVYRGVPYMSFDSLARMRVDYRDAWEAAIRQSTKDAMRNALVSELVMLMARFMEARWLNGTLVWDANERKYCSSLTSLKFFVSLEKLSVVEAMADLPIVRYDIDETKGHPANEFLCFGRVKMTMKNDKTKKVIVLIVMSTVDAQVKDTFYEVLKSLVLDDSAEKMLLRMRRLNVLSMTPEWSQWCTQLFDFANMHFRGGNIDITVNVWKDLYRTEKSGAAWCPTGKFVTFKGNKVDWEIDKSKDKELVMQGALTVRDFHENNRYDKSFIEERKKTALPLDYFQGHPDFKCKLDIYNMIMNTSYNSYQQMLDHGCKCDDETDLIKAVISQESGRCLGFLHNSERAVKKLERQFDGFIDKTVGLSFFKRDPELLTNMPIPQTTDEFKLLADTIITMPLNSSSGMGSMTGLQYIINMKPEDVFNEIDSTPKNWRVSYRLDQGDNTRMIFVRSIIVRLFDYMSLKHVYDYIKTQPYITMGKTQKQVHDMIFSGKTDDEEFRCKDYANFDAHISSTDIYQLKSLYGRKFYNSDKYVNYERFDYPLIESGSNRILMWKADRLMSGDYSTAIMSALQQLSTFKLFNKQNILLHPKVFIGDDLVATSPKSYPDEYVMNAFSKLNDPMSAAKSWTHDKFALYNRRLWAKDIYPFNNPFTLINNIFRKEKMDISHTIMNFDDRIYDIYTAYVAFRVLMTYVRRGDDCVNRLHSEISKHTTYDLNQLVLCDFESKRRSIDTPQYNLVRYLSDYWTDWEYRHPIFKDLLNVDPTTALRRYATSPYIDSSDIRATANTTEPGLVDVRLLIDNYPEFTDIPEWIRNSIYYRRVTGNLHLTLFSDVVSKLQLPLKPFKTARISNTVELVSYTVEYLESIYPETRNLRNKC